MAATAEDECGRKAKPSGRGYGKESAKNDDGHFDVKIGPHRNFDGFGEARKEVGDDQAGNEGKNVSTFTGQPQGPVDAELLLFGGRDGGEVRIVADNPARIGDPEDGGERVCKSLHVSFQRRRCKTKR